MSLAELKKQAGALSAQERLELAAYLAELEEQSEAGFHQARSAMQTIGRGAKVTQEQFEPEHLRRGKK